ncbi:MAG: hypothetical protein NZ898_12685, partial [Myxococcota bacterium]|nr:hypothetical protein [Myxococcota bacterium]
MLSRLTALGSLLPCTAVPFVSVARAQPADVVGGWEPSAARLEPAAPPADFVVERRGPVHWVYPPQATEHVRELQRIQARRWPELLEELGAVDGGPLEIRVARNPAEMAAMGPPAHPPPPYAIGVAYPRHSLVLVSLTAPRSGRVGEATSVLVHELSHVALHRASGGAPLPRWFVEGVAIHQAGEASLSRTRLLWGATVAGRLLPLEELERRFPS